ncbi:hypothetical protein [Psychroflexus salis]|uniref:Uncharacterized protein n=1 Tax=Psychroflexus salis TaxID=1526574 RepID=A0A916ZLW6_9FLAO|nr:hypothetical protein [Psychroflexus salis]GGE04150.1 hypothetical protein GCM10010831_02170 [Psychroflexus salis]
MARDEQLKELWEQVEQKISTDFGDGERLELDAIIYLIGVQEYGKPHKRFKKDDKINLMHIAICRLLEPFGYYNFDFIDDEGWPHYQITEKLPNLKAGEQSVLMKEAIIQYFQNKKYI